MILFGKRIKVNDNVYSETMGYGKVLSMTAKSLMVSHDGQQWRYNRNLIRQGCKNSDLGWRPRHTGNQIKENKVADLADNVIASVSTSLRENYG